MRSRRAYTESGPHQIGRVYKKAIYREYTDATFSTLKPRAPEDQYLGIIGPILRGAVGDTIKIVFKNNATHPYSMHPHGVLYEKDSEGADYNDSTSGAGQGRRLRTARRNSRLHLADPRTRRPRAQRSEFRLLALPLACEELRDVASGCSEASSLRGAAMALPDGRPKDVDHEFVSMFIAINENESWYLDDNIRDHTTDPKGVNKQESSTR